MMVEERECPQVEPAEEVGGTHFRVPGRITGNLIGEYEVRIVHSTCHRNIDAILDGKR
jgi:hypothetical protein